MLDVLKLHFYAYNLYNSRNLFVVQLLTMHIYQVRKMLYPDILQETLFERETESSSASYFVILVVIFFF